MSRATDIYSAPVTFSAVRNSGVGRSPQKLDCLAVERFELFCFCHESRAEKKVNSLVERRRLRERERVIRAGDLTVKGVSGISVAGSVLHGCGTGAVPERRGDGEVSW